MTRSGATAIAGTLACLSLSGCGTGSANPVKHLASSQVPSLSPPQKHYAQGTGHLHVAITPARGPVGTKVRIRATGCGDPDGQNHAVSFNPGFANTQQAAWANYPQKAIPSRLAGQTLTATYVITRRDAGAAANADPKLPTPQFDVQCSDDNAVAGFHITG